MENSSRRSCAAPVARPRGRRPLRWLAPGALVFLVAMPWPAALAAPDDLAPGTFVLETDDIQRVTLRANGAPLAEILADLGSQLGIEIKGTAPAGSPVTANMSRLPLPNALRRLTENYMALTDESTGRITRIILLPKGDGTRYVPPAPAANDDADAVSLIGSDNVSQPSEEDTVDESTIGITSGGGIDFDPDEAADSNPRDEEADGSADSWETEMQEDLQDD